MSKDSLTTIKAEALHKIKELERLIKKISFMPPSRFPISLRS